MDHAPQQDSHQNKGSMFWRREHSDGSVDWRTTDHPPPPQDEKRPIRRVPSPSRLRPRPSNHYSTKHGGHYYRSREEHSPYRTYFSHQRQYHSEHRSGHHLKEHYLPKHHHHHAAQREREKDREKEYYEWRDRSPPPQSSTTRAYPSRSTSSRDKDTQFSAGQQRKRSHSGDRNHGRAESKEREESREEEEEPPTAESHTVARDRAIQRKRREIDEAYHEECEMFGLVAKMLIEKDPSLEVPIQSSLQKNLRDIGKRCVDAMEKFIEEYDSPEHAH